MPQFSPGLLHHPLGSNPGVTLLRSLPRNSRLDKAASLVTSDFLVHFSFLSKLCIGCSPVLCEVLLRVDLSLIYLYTPRTQHCIQYIVISLKTLVGIKMDWTKEGNIRIPGLFCDCLYNISIEKKRRRIGQESNVNPQNS